MNTSIRFLTLSILFILFFSVKVFAAAQDTKLLGLDEAISIALKQSPVLKASKNELNATTFGVRAERGKFFPQITGYADYSRKSDPVVVVPIKEFGGKPPSFSRDQYAVGIRILIPVYEGGRLWARLSAAKLHEEIAKKNLSLTRQDLIANVTNTFNQILYLRELVKAQKESLHALEKARKDASLKLKIGKIAPVDLMRMDTQVAAQKQEIISAKEEEKRAINALCQLIGWKDKWLPNIKGYLSDSINGPDTDNPDSLIKDALKRRPDILASQASVKKAEAELKYAKGWHLPSLNLVGDYSRHAGSGLRYDEEVWSGGVALSLNIFSGGTISAQVSEAASRLQAEMRRLQNQKLKARREILDSLSRLREALHRHRVAKAVVKTARETFRIEQLKYDTGAGSVTDSLLAQAQWQRAIADEVSARFLIQKATVDLRLALGLIDKYKKENQGSE